MDFFKLRVVNTALVLLAGLLLGYIIKDPPGSRPGPYVPVYPRVQAAPEPAPPPQRPAAAPPAQPKPAAAAPEPAKEDDAEEYALPVKPAEKDFEVTYRSGEPDKRPADRAPAAEPAPRQAAAAPEPGIVKGAEEAFFKNPARYAGQYLEMELQMILARRTGDGWTLNLVHSRGGAGAEYLYIEDDFMLGEKPDLRIGFFYNVSFKCSKGQTASGNKLLGINPSGRKASWATGVTAVE